MIGRIACGGIALALTGVGLGAIAAPRRSSAMYGLPATDGALVAYVRALGARDLVIGLIALRPLASGDDAGLASAVGIATLAAVADLAGVASVRGLGAHLAPHAAGVVGMLAAVALLRAEAGLPGPTPPAE